MGVTSTPFHMYPDGYLAGGGKARVVRDIVHWSRQVRPDVVNTWGPDGGYGHPDHIAAGERALVALELASIERHDVGLGPPHRVRRCYRFVQAADFIDGLKTINPQFVRYMETLAVKPQRRTRERLGAAIDVSAVADRKVQAIRLHETPGPDVSE